LKNDLFFDETSKTVQSRVMLNIEQFEVGQSYVTSKVQNRYGEKVTINIQRGRPGIELQETFLKQKGNLHHMPI
jgi:hypothetical protein